MNRYVTASERATALAEGTYLYAQYQNGREGLTKEWYAFDEWAERWGSEMRLTAIRYQDRMLTRAIGWD
jgi:hypothetical protein